MPPGLMNPAEWVKRNRPFLRGVLLGIASACAAFAGWLLWFLTGE